MALKIEDYGLIGNLRTAALVSRNGSVDWASAPAFDSDAFFASMVGYDQHGRWSLRPATAVRRIRQRYREDSLILETEFACDGGLLKVVDFMPIAGAMGAQRLLHGLPASRAARARVSQLCHRSGRAPWPLSRAPGRTDARTLA